MRVNVYGQELSRFVSLVTQENREKSQVFFGVRFALLSQPLESCVSEDDDRSAVTFWVPTVGSFSKRDLAKCFRDAAEILDRLHLTDEHLTPGKR